MKKQLLTAILLTASITSLRGGNFNPATTFGAAPAAPSPSFDTLSAYSIYGLLDRAKIAAFSTDSFKRSGADQKSVTAWNALTDNLNQYGLQNVSAADKAAYQKAVQDLTGIRAYVEGTINALKNNSVRTTAAEAQKYALNASAIEQSSIQKIKDQASAQWLMQQPKENILKDNNLNALNDYKRIADQADKERKPLRDFEIQGLLKLNNISGRQIDVLINLLEQRNYTTKDRHAQRFANDLSRIYKALSGLTLTGISTTKDKPSVILFAQAGAYENVLRQIIRELGQ